jgi:SAM-dependent methyltransferase
LELCSSAEWADAVRRWIIPWVLDGLELGDDVLEVGPGPGRTTEVLSDMLTRLSALELDAGLANDLADRLGAKGVEVTEGDATQSPYEDGRFSAVVSFTMLHHLPSSDDQDRLFAEAARVLRSGGVFAGTDSLDSEEFRALHIDDICVPIEPGGLALRLTAAGLTNAEVETNEYGIRFRGWRS